MQQFRTAAHHPTPLLIDTGQITRYVDDHHQRNPERIAQSHETRGLFGTLGVQAAAKTQGIVRQYADSAPGQPAQTDHHRRSPLGLELLERFVGVQQGFNEWMYVIGSPRRVRQEGVQIDVAGLGLGAVEDTLLAEQSDQPASAGVGVGFVVGDDVAHPGLTVVGVRPAEGGHVDVLSGHAANNIGPGDEHPALRCHHDHIGQRGPVGRTARGEADHQGDLRDIAGGPDHRLEHQADRVQCLDTLGQSGATGVPDSDDRALLLDCEVVGVDDLAAAVHAHGTAHDGSVGAERNGAQAVDSTGRGQDAGLVALMQQLDTVVVEEGSQPQ